MRFAEAVPDSRACSPAAQDKTAGGSVHSESLVDVPIPQYAKAADGAFIAYQVVGDGPVDIAWQFDFGWNLDA
jgi:hypothetical protein